MTKVKVIEELLELYSNYGRQDYIGEPVSQLEHMSQAAQLAMEEGYDDEVILAAFLHDVGHLCVNKNQDNAWNGLGIKNHETVGSLYLRHLGFSDRLIRLVGGHVEAKRYLCFKFPEYFNKLSDASKQTLKLQGGIMSRQEATEFEQNPLSKLMIKMREWDDEAKEIGKPTIDLKIIAEKIERVLGF